jgi:hypothetical protein
MIVDFRESYDGNNTLHGCSDGSPLSSATMAVAYRRKA